MAAPKPSASELCWSYVIEALASSPEVGVAILYDLVHRTHDLYDTLGTEARERLALRSLELMCDPATKLKGPDASTHPSYFDSSESLEKLVHRIGKESPLLNLSKSIQQDLRLTIEHKKAHLPKTTLEQLQDKRREGHNQTIYVNDSDGDMELDNVPDNATNKDMVDHADARLAGTTSMDGSQAKNNKNSDLLQLEQEAEISCRNEDGDGNDDSKKCTEADMELDHDKPHQEEVTVGGENRKDSDIIQLEPEAERSSGNEEGDYASERGNDDSKNATEVDMVLDIKKPHQQDISVCGETPQNNDLLQLEHEAERSRGHGDEVISTEETDGGSKKCSEADMELDHNKPHQEEVDVSGENHKNNDHILSEQENEKSGGNEEGDCTAKEGGDDSNKYSDADMEQIWPEQKLCMKCNKDGDVLICSSCPIRVHQRCLGFSASSSKGSFCCPFCTFSNAVAQHAKSRAELSMFIGGTPGFKWQAQSKRAAEENVLPSQNLDRNNGMNDRSSNDKHKVGPGFMDADVTLSKIQNTNLNNSPRDTHSRETEKRKMVEHQTEKGPNKKPKQVKNNVDNGVNDGKVAFNGMNDRTNIDKHKDGPGFMDADVTLSKIQNTNLNNSPLDTHSRETEKRKMVEHQTEKGSNKKPKQVENNIDKGVNDGKVAFSCKTQAEVESSQENQEHQSLDQPKDASSSASLSEESSSDDDNKAANSKYSLKRVKRESLPVHAASLHWRRRNKNAWTAEEEEMLKEGVNRFASTHSTMPWTSILDFGRSVFSSRRTPVNLKDKWRNMVKADPGLRRLVGA